VLADEGHDGRAPDLGYLDPRDAILPAVLPCLHRSYSDASTVIGSRLVTSWS
jgi:hypothetical protein